MSRTPRSFFASAVQIKLRDKPKPRKTEDWQRDAWEAFERVGEIQHAIEFRANLISKVRLYPALTGTDPREKPTPDEDPTSIASIQSLRSQNGDYSSILRELSVNLDVAGEAYLVGKGNAQNEVEYWDIYSCDELSWTEDRFYIREYPGASKQEYTEDSIIVIRIYFPHPRWGALPISPIRGILASAEEVQRIERVIRGAAVSRSAGAGLLLIPDEISFGSTDPTTEDSDGESVRDKFKKALMEAMVTPIQNEGDASSVVPFIIGAPAEFLKEIRKVDLSTDVDTELLKLDRAITRLAQGLPLPPEVVTGKEGLSHWCIDEKTQVLTRRGWLGIDEMRAGDIALTLNHQTGFSEWAEVSEMKSWGVQDEPMIHLRGQSHDSLTTLNHRWPVLSKVKKGDRARRWKTSDQLRSGDQIITAAVHDSYPTEPKYSDAFVEMVAWFFTEGTCENRPGRHSPRVAINQSHAVNARNCERIRRALTDLYGPPSDLGQGGRHKTYEAKPRWRERTERGGKTVWILNRAAAESLVEVAPNRVVSLDFVCALTHSQLELFIDTAVRGDGSKMTAAATRYVGQKDAARLDAIELAAILAGYAANRFETTHDGFHRHTQQGLTIGTRMRFSPHPKRQFIESYTGRIWCPVIPATQSFLARRNGAVFYTGNSAWQVAEELVTSYVEPMLSPMVNALAGEYHRPFLLASGMAESDVDQRILWYDVTPLVTRPNRSADADFGLEHIAISDEEWRKVKGFTEEASPDGTKMLARLMLQRGSFDPATTTALMKAAGILSEDFVSPAEAKQVPPTPQPRSGEQPEDRSPPAMNRPRDNAPPTAGRSRTAAIISLPSAGRNDDQISLQLSELDRELRLRLHTTAEAAVQRALERASATLIAKLKKKGSRYSTLLRDAPKLEAASRVGRPSVESEGIDVASLFAGSFDSLASRFKEWTSRAYLKSSRILDIPITTPTDLISSAADTLISDLTSYSCERIFDATARSEPFGEVEDSAVLPHSLIRNALYKAGGGTELLPSNLSPPGGISTGANVLKAILDAGGYIDGWEWIYATTIRSRDFEPHAQLDGVRFSGFNDRALRNPGTWPPVTNLSPGDHAYCFCSVRPLIRLPDIEATA